jgi:hypothetical protein
LGFAVVCDPPLLWAVVVACVGPALAHGTLPTFVELPLDTKSTTTNAITLIASGTMNHASQPNDMPLERRRRGLGEVRLVDDGAGCHDV